MNAIVIVALITALSTLSGALIAGLISLKAQSRQIKSQADLAEKNRVEERLYAYTESRRQAYIEFLDRVNEIQQMIAKCWLEPCAESKQSPASEISVTAYETITKLEDNISAIELVGPEEVLRAAQIMLNMLIAELKLIQNISSLPNTSKSVMEESKGGNVEMLNLRRQLRSDFLLQAQNVLRPPGVVR
jgi:hypothetical protein